MPNKGKLDRKINTKVEQESILVVCEGQKTEPNYFRSFQCRAAVILGPGMNTLSLVEKAIYEDKVKGPFTHKWVVFDKDSFSNDVFNRAIYLAESNGFQVAYSNESFELWYVLHFDYLESQITRSDYINVLEKRLNKAYVKNSKEMYNILSGLQGTAIRNSVKLLSTLHKGCNNPSEIFPGTTVHLLVEFLNGKRRL